MAQNPQWHQKLVHHTPLPEYLSILSKPTPMNPCQPYTFPSDMTHDLLNNSVRYESQLA